MCQLVRRCGRAQVSMLPRAMLSALKGASASAETAVAPDVGAGIAEPVTGVVVERALSLEKCLEVAERGAIERALVIAGGSKTEAARILGISRNTLYAKLRRIAAADSTGAASAGAASAGE